MPLKISVNNRKMLNNFWTGFIIMFGFLFVYRTSGFAEGTCIQENSNKVWFSLHLIVPLASLNGNKRYNKAVCCYATDGSTAARIEEKVD